LEGSLCNSRSSGGAKVIALASGSKVDLVKGLGADHVFDYVKAGWAAKALDVIGPQGVQGYRYNAAKRHSTR
jgi:NADPH:quinone reductase-like Zn-dependent oxidoreductase